MKAGLPAGLAQAMSAIVFGGASQFVGVRLIAGGVPGEVIVLTMLLVNARHLLYSASLAPHTDHLPRPWRWLLAYFLTDEAYATGIVRYRRAGSANAHWFIFGSGSRSGSRGRSRRLSASLSERPCPIAGRSISRYH